VIQNTGKHTEFPLLIVLTFLTQCQKFTYI
jgi:hypothetical protein